jgi:hypothetical protein
MAGMAGVEGDRGRMGGEKANGGRLHWTGLVWLDDRRRRRER